MILLAAVVLGRVEFAMIAVPFAVGTALHLWNVPRDMANTSLQVDSRGCEEGESRTGTFTIDNPSDATVAVHVEVPTDKWIPFHHGTSYAAVVPAGSQHVRTMTFNANRWGRHTIGPLQVRMVAAGGLLQTPLRIGDQTSVNVRAKSSGIHFDTKLPKATGFVGIHLSRRHGDAAELAEVRHFQPGDRLRRIDWRMTARSRDVYVNATESERDADVTLILDLTDEVGVSSGVFGEPSAIDLAVRTATSVAEEFIKQGDQISVYEFSGQPRHLRSGTGHRQREALASWLSYVSVPNTRVEVSARQYLSMIRPHRGLHVVLTPLLTSASTDLVALLTRMGRQVTCINTLPPGVEPVGSTNWKTQAERLWHLERDNLIASVRERGIRLLSPSELVVSADEPKEDTRDLVA